MSHAIQIKKIKKGANKPMFASVNDIKAAVRWVDQTIQSLQALPNLDARIQQHINVNPSDVEVVNSCSEFISSYNEKVRNNINYDIQLATTTKSHKTRAMALSNVTNRATVLLEGMAHLTKVLTFVKEEQDKTND